MTTTLPNRIIKYFVDTSNPSQSGFYFYEKAGAGGFVRLGSLADASRAGGNTFEIDSSTAENVIYNGLGGADTYVVRSNLDKNIEISDPHTGDDGSGNEVKNTIVFDSDVTVTSISANQVTRLEGTGGLRIELTLDTGAVITVNGPDVFQYVVGGATALDFAGFIATYGASGIAPANRAPVIESALSASIDENVDGSAAPVSIGRVVASDADASDSLTYSIVNAVDQNGGNVAGFEVDGTGLITYVGTGLDAETITSVALTVSVSDGQESTETSVAISVADLNDEAPTITSGATNGALTEGVAVPNTQVIYTATGVSDRTDISWTLSGPDAGLFNIDRATGEVRFNTETTPDHEVKDSYNFTVVATSGALAAVEQAVTIAVTDIDERNASSSVKSVGSSVTSDGDINAAVAGDVLMAEFGSPDPDNDGTFTYQWYRDGVDIAGATGASYTITEGDEGNSLYVVAHYTYGNGGERTVTSFGIIVPTPVDNADSSSTATPFEAPAILSLADLNPASGFRIDGEAGWAVSSAGDVNGDGIDDFAIGTLWGGPGSTYVVFGKANGFNAVINLRSLNAGDGFRIDDENNGGHWSGESISAGDVNGDGYDDIIIGSHRADYNGGDSGSTYVVFGKESGFRTTDLSELDGSDGFRIDGASAGDLSGYSVATGDVNGDGYDDVIIGAQYADYNGIHSGSTYVVFGKESGFSRTTALSELDGSDGFRIDGDSANDSSGYSVSLAGDINGDGYDDIIVSARQTDSNEHRANGSSYVIFGKESGFSRTMNLSELDGSNGFRMDLSGRSVSSAGDVNGDGYDDIIIEASRAGVASSLGPLTYVVFGKESGFSRTVNLSELDGSDGFGINRSGGSVSSAGDFNGDGYDDIIIGAKEADSNGGQNSESSYVVFGKESGFSRRMDLSELDGSDGFRIDGGSAIIDGLSVSSAGDVNDDGYDDIMIGKSVYGTSYIIYGRATSSVTDTEEDTAAPANIIVKYFVDTSNPSQSGFYFYEVAGDDNLVRLDRVHEGTLGGDDTFEIDSPTAENVIYNGLGGADTYVIRGRLDNDVQIHDIDFGDDGSGNEVKNTIVFASDVTVTSIYQDRLQGRADVIKIEQTLDTDAVVTVHVPDAFEYVVGGAAALDFAEFIATYGASGISATNRAPVFENEPTDLSINENADGSAVPVSVGRVVASDADAGDTLTYSIVSTADQNGDSVTGFEVDGTGLITYVGTGLNAETITSVVLTVSASDGQESAQTSVAISVADLNDDAPTITSGATGNALTENATVPNTQVIYTATGTSDVTDISWSLSGPDAGLFNIDRATGEVRFDTETTPDAESKDIYSFAVVATSGTLAAVEQAVAIAVTNIDEGNASFVVTSDGDITAAVAGDVLTVRLRSSDPDGDGAFTYQWYRDGVDIAGATGASYTITEGDEGNSLYVAVRYTDGSGADETVTASGVIVPVPANRAPVFENEPTDLSINENADGSAAPVSVGRVVASDADAADTLTYSIVNTADQNGGDVTGFEVDGAGLVTYVGTGLDAETITSVVLTVSASDGQESVQTSVAISVTNIDEGNASFVVTSDRDINVAVAGDVLTVGLRSSDPDGDGAFTYQWYRDGVDIADATGASYTIPEDYDGNSIYVVVRYTDGSGADETVTASGVIVPVPEYNADNIAPATPPATPAVLSLADLDPTIGFRLIGGSGSDYSGWSVSSVGDINGDGIDDFAIGAKFADHNGRSNSGSTYIVYGNEEGFDANIDLSTLNIRDGFRIDGESAYDSSGVSISGAGDVNGDGYDDIIIGAHWADPNGNTDSGSTYVVFGKDGDFTSNIDLSNLTISAGIRINGENRYDNSGYSVSSGDVNGDDYDDIIIGAYRVHSNEIWSGSTYVVFGDENSLNTNIELSDIATGDGSAGFRLDGENPQDYSGRSISSDDVNGDGYDDIIIGAYLADPNGNTDSGSTYVVSGKAAGEFSSGTIDLATIVASDENAGFRLNGESAGDYSGYTVSSVGDINGDGYDDFAIGAIGADPNGPFSGSTYVVFGDGNGFESDIELSDIANGDGSAGFRLNGENEGDRNGVSVSSAGDFNGDGYDDIIIGAHWADPNGLRSGSTYVVFGKESDFGATVELSDIVASGGRDGFRIDGEGVNDFSGKSVSSAGDVNNDGYDDIIIGGYGAGGHTGYSYVIYGHATYGASGISATNRAPVFENEPTDLSINENADGSAASVSVGRVVSRDADEADTLTYSIINTADQNGDSVTGFEVDGAGLITYVGTGLDAEAITSVALTVSASDGQESAQTSAAISVTNIDEGNASFVVTSDRDINAAVAGDVLTVGLRSSDPDGDGTFSYQWYRDGVDIAGATGASYTIPEDYDGNSIYVVVRYTDGSGADETITASGIIVPLPVDNDDDASEDPVNTTYTMTQAPTGVSLTRGGVALSVGETFTYQDIQGGSVALTVNDENALSGLKLTTDDGTDTNPSEISLDIEVREVADIAAPEVGNDLDYSENEGSLVIDTGDYGDQITAAQGSDFITGGLGDDTINLDPVEGRETGQDTVVYNFGSGSIFTATDGGDDITGFKRGEDIFLLKTESDNPELATLDGLFSYVSGPNKGSSHDDLMIVRPNYEYEPDGSGGLNFFLTGIEFHFEDGGVYGNGYLAQGHVSITFDERLPWEEFLSLIEIDNGNGSIDGNFDHRRGIIRDLSTLPNLMGEGSLAYEVEAPAQTPPQDVDVVPLEDDIPATSFDVV